MSTCTHVRVHVQYMYLEEPKLSIDRKREIHFSVEHWQYETWKGAQSHSLLDWDKWIIEEDGFWLLSEISVK